MIDILLTAIADHPWPKRHEQHKKRNH